MTLFSIELLLIGIPALPLAAAALTALFGPRLLKSQSHWPAVVAIAASFVCSVALLQQVRQAQRESSAGAYEELVTLWTWADVGGAYALPGGAGGPGGLRDFRIEVVLRADALTAMMLAMVTLISTLVAVFSMGYMRGDRGYWRFFTYIALFVFSMTMLVSVSNFALLYVFWEAVGVCSYLLIGFWYEKPEAAAAGKKAFLVNRVGDFGFAVALFLIWISYGTLNYHDTPAEPAVLAETSVEAGVLGVSRLESNQFVGGGLGLAICLLLLLGACGKSAQFPLHVWLPDAMEGPTPVSALIHAATMVTAGVYMIARCAPLFLVSPEAQLTVAAVGGLTALLGALIALTQFDLKRILAYSTISQLGYMFVGLGVGTFAGITSGMFHLFTHAFFKALLFLGAGSVMHAMGNVIDVRRFGGLRRRMPITHLTFLVGCLALAGAPPLSGFFSKDAILAAVHDKSHHLELELEHRGATPPTHGQQAADTPHAASQGHGESEEAGRGRAAYAGLSERQLKQGAWLYRLLYWVAVATAALTAFYAFRAFFLAFYGEERIPFEAAGHAHESPAIMWVPLVLLAVGAALAGICFDWTIFHGGQQFARFLAHTPSLALGKITATAQHEAFHWRVAGLSVLAALSGIGTAAFFYLGRRQRVARLRSILDFQALRRLQRVDWVDWLVSNPRAVRWRRGADAVGLGWLASLVGQALAILAVLLAVPLLIVGYLSPYKLSFSKFFFDEVYQVLVVMPLQATAYLCDVIDRWLVDGLVDLCGRIPVAIGSLLRTMQMGLVQFYALAMALGVLVLLAAGLFFWAAG